MGAPMSTSRPVRNAVDALFQQRDGVAIWFWMISFAMMAKIVFFFVEGVHYMYTRMCWIWVHQSPVVYRYMALSIIVPLQMIEFILILKAAGANTTAEGFSKILFETVMMRAFGYMGEESIIPAWPGYAVGMTGWGIIFFEIFSSEAGGLASDCIPHVAASFNNMRVIATVGWAMYHAGNLFGYLHSAVDNTILNVVYNIADFINNIAFVLACWFCVKAESAEKASHLCTLADLTLVGGFVTLVAGVYYMYMREYRVQLHDSPIVYHYIALNITVPLQVIEFNLILRAAGKTTTAAGFLKLFVGTILMPAFGYMGKESIIPAWPGFAVGMAGWGFILFEIFSGEAGGLASDCISHVAASFNNMRVIITVSWAIYPAGYLFGYLLSAVHNTTLNVVYNVADFVDNIAFVLACWSCAKAESAEKASSLV